MTPGYTPERNEHICPHKNLYMNAYNNIIHNSQRVEMTQMSINSWINKMWYRHTMDYYSVLKRKEILTHATPCMNLEDIMLSHNRTNAVWLHLYKVPKAIKFIETQSRMVVARDRGEVRIGS